ncbi:MAG: ABC transporter permease, partial [Gemmatimonadota bacterium]
PVRQGCVRRDANLYSAPIMQPEPMRRSLRYYIDLLTVLLAKELKVRYKSTVLGYAWSVLHPLAFAGVFFLVFSVFLRVRIEHHALFLIAGLFPWQWFANSANGAHAHFLRNASLLKKVRFPRWMLVVADILNNTIHFLLSVPVIVVFMLFYRIYPTVGWLWTIPLLVAVQFMFTLGFALLVATANLFFRDLERLVVIATMIWFYLTPVLYHVDMIPPQWRWSIYVNPMASLTICWQSVFLSSPLPWEMLGAAAVWSVAMLAIGYRVYASHQWRFAEVV